MIWRASILRITGFCAAVVLYGCSQNDVFQPSADQHLVNHCMTGDQTTVTLYEDDGGGAAVGTWWRVAAEKEPLLPKQQVIYSDYRPALLSLTCDNDGIVLKTSTGLMRFSNGEINALRGSPRNLGEEYRRDHPSAN